MKITFKKLNIHHFLSMGDAQITLNDRGYCLVSGINNNPNDAAKSNGSGKSTIWNALSYVLTGKTIQGISSDLPNNYFNDGCWVSLEFEVDNDTYVLTRSKNDKSLGTNLKISVNGVDKSGKGIQESQKILNDLLPDLNEELLGGVVIFGQGMPDKFTKNTPSKRKEILEHLSKSDFMIEDLKNRINNRINDLSISCRNIEDLTLTQNTQKSIYSQQLINAQEELNALISSVVNVDFDSLLNELQTNLTSLEHEFEELTNKNNDLNKQYDNVNNQLVTINSQKQNSLNKVRNSHEEYTKEFSDKKNKLVSDIYILRKEIEKIQSISDVCPTCGQKIPNVVKPTTEDKEIKLNELNNSLNELNNEIDLDSKEYNNVLEDIDKKFNDDIKSLQEHISKIKEGINNTNTLLHTNNYNKLNLTQQLTSNKIKRDTYLDNKKKIETTINTLNTNLETLENELSELSNKYQNVKIHQDIINKMNTYIKRDFRGYLLQNVINYIELKAKEYSAQIFDTDNIRFALDGNNIEISFCGKDYFNLSGGEQKRVDLIVQFAIRDMMCKFLDFSCNILVLDEITDALDSVSCDRVLNFITKELSSVGSVFIISHHANELGIASDSEIVVIKNSNGISDITSQY